MDAKVPAVPQPGEPCRVIAPSAAMADRFATLA
jgi:hypothetical protein